MLLVLDSSTSRVAAVLFYCMSNMYYNSAFKLNRKQLQHSLLLKLREPNTNAAAIVSPLAHHQPKEYILLLTYALPLLAC
uniref:Uncharacterized protein n=1 Tax=Glossina palpalis gambiensis TaxID=67801 RepID=A0A1B0BFQ4_9MUSC